MKNIQLLTKEIENNGQKIVFDYADIIKTILGTATVDGLQIEEIRIACKIIDKIKDDQLSLEDQEWEYLNSKISNFKWAIAHPVIIEFCDDIKKATA